MTSISIKGTHSNSGSPPGLKLISPRVPASWHVVVVVDPQEMLVTARYPRDQSTPPIPTAEKDHTGAPSITPQKKAAAHFHGTKSRGGPARRLCEMVMASNGGFTAWRQSPKRTARPAGSRHWSGSVAATVDAPDGSIISRLRVCFASLVDDVEL